MFFLPLEQTDDPESQAGSVACFENLLSDAPYLFKDPVQTNPDFDREHFVLIERLCRLLHPNVVLGRTSSENELAFLATPKASFEQG